jgi:hypothetical protein
MRITTYLSDSFRTGGKYFLMRSGRGQNGDRRQMMESNNLF